MDEILGGRVCNIKTHLLVKFGAIWMGKSPGTPMPISGDVADREADESRRRPGGVGGVWRAGRTSKMLLYI